MSPKGKSKQTPAVVDRLEDGGLAVVMVGEDGATSIDLPASLLPAGAEAGSHLVISVSLDEEAGRAAAERVGELQERLEKRGDSGGQKNFKL